MQVEFRYAVGQEVRTPFGEAGIVRMIAVDREGKQCSVQTKSQHTWFPEEELSPVEPTA